MSYAQYQIAQQNSESPKQSEARALTLANSRLIAAKESGSHYDVIAAVHFNRRVWTVFQTDLISPDNALPDYLKAQLISLAIWVQKQGSKVMRKQANIDTLVEVNQNIIEGLSIQAAPQPQPQPQPQSAQGGDNAEMDNATGGSSSFLAASA